MSRKVGENFTRNTWLGVPDSAGVGTFQSKKGCFRCFWPTESAKNAQVPIPLKKSELPAPQKLVYFAATNTLRSTGPSTGQTHDLGDVRGVLGRHTNDPETTICCCFAHDTHDGVSCDFVPS
jgi:hypothetical protein